MYKITGKPQSFVITLSLGGVIAILVLAVRVGAKVQRVYDLQQQTMLAETRSEVRLSALEAASVKRQGSLDKITQYLKDIHHKLKVPPPPDPPARTAWKGRVPKTAASRIKIAHLEETR